MNSIKMLFISNDFSTVHNPFNSNNGFIYEYKLSKEYDELFEAHDEIINLLDSKMSYSDYTDVSRRNDTETFIIVTSDHVSEDKINLYDFFVSLNDDNHPYCTTISKWIKESNLPKAEQFEALNCSDIKRISNFSTQIEKAENLNDKDKQIKSLLNIANKQQKMLENLVTNETKIFSLMQNFKNYRLLAMRGLSFMSSGHEMAGIFQSLQSFIKRKGSEFNFISNDLNRLEDIFAGQKMAVKSNFSNFNPFYGKHLIEYCDNVFPKDKKIIFCDNIKNLKTEFPIRRTSALTILSNLIRNGFSFGDTVEVKLVNDLLVITDNGKGIDKKNISKLFSIGFTTKSNGHGFGLVLCKEKALEEKCNLYFDPDNKYSELNGASFIYDLCGKNI